VSHFTGTVLKDLDRAFNHGTISGLSEGILLERFVSHRDEAAFGALVARHGPMVLGVCRRLLRDESDVDDAFQATFLVLVRRAGAIRRRELLGHWLFGVAHRVAVRARALAARRRLHEPTGLDVDEMDTQAKCHADEAFELRMVIGEELARLPEALRSPVVLCYLEGLTHDEAARQLNWPVGTVRSRMARARGLLRRRLAKRGFLAEEGMMATALLGHVVPIDLINRTVKSSPAFATKKAAATGLATTSATLLAKGALSAMTLSKLKTLGLAIIALGLTFGGIRTLAVQHGGKAPAPKPVAPAVAQTDDPRETLLRSVDKVDDLLDDLARRNADVQRELRVLRREIADLRSAGLKGPDPIIYQSSLGNLPQQPAAGDVLEPGGGKGTPPPSDSGDGSRTAKVNDGEPSVYELSYFLMVTSPRGERAAIYNRNNGRNSSIRLPVPAGARHKLDGVQGPDGAVALAIQGPTITRIAVYTDASSNVNSEVEGWYAQDLREPVTSASPIVGASCVAYTLGRYIYAFSTTTKSWDVLELDLPKGHKAELGLSEDQQEFKVVSAGHVYRFRQDVGIWKDLDLNAILDGKQPLEIDGATPAAAKAR
jgi:RNA polymerase sigma factor (sigma-70 family)